MVDLKFTKKQPTKVGLYEITCSENNYVPERVAITRNGSYLQVHSNDLGVTDLDSFHAGLIDLKWCCIA